MEKDQGEIARYPAFLLDDGRRFVNLKTLTDTELIEFSTFVKRFPSRFVWSEEFDGFISTD